MSTLNLAKGVKKGSSAPASTSVSPAPQKSITTFLQQETQQAQQKDTQAILQAIADCRMDMKKDLERNYEDLKNDILKMDQRMEAFQQAMIDTQQRMQKIEDKSAVVDEKLVALQEENQRLAQSNAELEGNMAVMEMERTSYFLRFQNVIEEKDENLLDLMSGLLADLLGIEKDQMNRELDQVFRVNSNYARRNRVPREVHVRFLKRNRRDEILRIVRDQPMKYKDKELVVLKQIPRKIREARRDYQFLTRKLIDRGVNFRWLIPEGLLIFWDSKRYRLDTPFQAEEFFNKHRAFLEKR